MFEYDGLWLLENAGLWLFENALGLWLFENEGLGLLENEGLSFLEYPGRLFVELCIALLTLFPTFLVFIFLGSGAFLVVLVFWRFDAVLTPFLFVACTKKIPVMASANSSLLLPVIPNLIASS